MWPVWVLLSASLTFVDGIRWLAEPWAEAAHCPANRTERRELGLGAQQARMCRRVPELMPFIVGAAAQSVQVCQKAFALRRWTCASAALAPHLKADLTRGTKEQAFVYALSAAAVTHQVAKACARGALPFCPCGFAEPAAPAGQPDPPEAYKGCSDNVVYGKRVSREWADSAWRRPALRKRKVARHSNQTARLTVIEFDEEHLNEDVLPQAKTGPRARMNQHNNDVGRILTQQSLFRKCKCHGVSSGCDIQTCWYALPALEVLAEQLKERYNLAYQVQHAAEPRGGARQTRVPLLEPELLYLRPSPTFCEPDPEFGAAGTSGRECSAVPGSENDCETLCCGRGFNTQQLLVEEQCHCKYVHCCYIKCKKCTSSVDRHYCK